MHRIFFFLLTNFVIILTISFVTSVLGIGSYMQSNGIDMYSLIVFCLIWGMGGSFISLLLSKIMAKWMMKVRIIHDGESGRDAQFLIKTVRRLSQAAGLKKMPEVGIYQSQELNAFATGPSKNRALVAVSTGILNQMSQEELEGVLAHEISHVANGDMVTMTLVQGVINAFVMFFARIVAFALSNFLRKEDEDEGFSPMVHMLVIFVLEIFFSILGSFVVAYFSRVREYKADKGGAQLVGAGRMRAALEALKRHFEPSASRERDYLASLKISGRPSKFFALFSTHPPLQERIERLRQLSIV